MFCQPGELIEESLQMKKKNSNVLALPINLKDNRNIQLSHRVIKSDTDLSGSQFAHPISDF